MMIVVPLALALVLSLLYLTFHSLRDALMIFSGVLFARVGGVLGPWLRGMPFTISAGIGFVALAGASMLEGLVLVSYIRDRLSHGRTKREAIEQARRWRCPCSISCSEKGRQFGRRRMFAIFTKST
jgi:cobalt-zinc-cadmium resistance protein CzcA